MNGIQEVWVNRNVGDGDMESDLEKDIVTKLQALWHKWGLKPIFSLTKTVKKDDNCILKTWSMNKWRMKNKKKFLINYVNFVVLEVIVLRNKQYLRRERTVTIVSI